MVQRGWWYVILCTIYSTTYQIIRFVLYVYYRTYVCKHHQFHVLDLLAPPLPVNVNVRAGLASWTVDQ